jgi:hypothetical protein
MRCLHNQFFNRELQFILRLLENTHSPSMDSFQRLMLQVDKQLEQAKSNVTYLNILWEICNDLNDPNKIEESMTKILFLTLFIWMESSFYDTSYD